jgi:hypothetical protein
MKSSCATLAATLSANFLSNLPYYPNLYNGTINKYLASNGVLLTMCMESFCAIPTQIMGMDGGHVSASWINEIIGFRVITARSSIGYILDPSAVDILCIYPTDAATAGRDQYGCGAHFNDPVNGKFGYQRSNFISRMIHRRDIERMIEFNFGKHEPQDIPCNRLYHPFGEGTPIVWSINSTLNDTVTSFMYETMSGKIASWDAPFLSGGRAPCAIENEIPATLSKNDWWIYVDYKSWSPSSEWQLVMDSMMNVFVKRGGPHEMNLWNEIVLKLPKVSMSQIVTAVFLVVHPDMEENEYKQLYQQALQETRLLEKNKVKPLLIANLTALANNEPLFRCIGDEALFGDVQDEEDVEGDDSNTPTANSRYQTLQVFPSIRRRDLNRLSIDRFTSYADHRL